MDRSSPRPGLAPAVAVAWLLLAAAAAVHAATLRSVELRHRDAAEVAELVRAVAEPGEAVVANGQVLILKAAPGRLDELADLALSLDRPAGRLRISVRQARTDRREARGAGVAANVGAGGVRVVTPGGAPPDSVQVYGTARAGTRARDATQFVSAVEGRGARLAVGLQVPLTTVQYGPAGVRETVDWVDVTTGFDVIARVHGEDVTLDITPRDATPGRGGAVVFSAADTTVSGPLGTWIPLAGSVIETGADRRGMLAGTARHSRQEIAIEVMVERW